MAKVTDILKLLLVAAFCFCIYAGSADVGKGPGGPVVDFYAGRAGNGKGLSAAVAASSVNEAAKDRGPKSVRLDLQRIYNAEVGVREKSGNNDGDRVETYLRYVYLKVANPWCAAFVCWALGQAGIANPRSGWSPDLLPNSKLIWQRSRGLLKAGRVPQTGDVFGLWFPDKGRVAHVGFVDQWSDKYVISVEGNTNVSGGIDGDGVHRRRRMISSIYKVADYVGGKGL